MELKVRALVGRRRGGRRRRGSGWAILACCRCCGCCGGRGRGGRRSRAPARPVAALGAAAHRGSSASCGLVSVVARLGHHRSPRARAGGGAARTTCTLLSAQDPHVVDARSLLPSLSLSLETLTETVTCSAGGPPAAASLS